jgi:23S rRNA pseudouridine1911/1915/1917 synthase
MMQETKRVTSRWRIPREMQGLRADHYLTRRIGRISRTRAQKIIEACDFLLDDQIIKPSSRVKDGQIASLTRYAPDHVSDIDEFRLEKIFENEDILVINKPAGLSIHPSAHCLYKTLTYWLRKNYEGQRRINPCHRIDKETSGIVVCAKNREAERAIKKSFMYGHVKKTYLALVTGVLKGTHTIDIPLGQQKDRGIVAIRMIEDQHGKPAVTKIRALVTDTKKNRSLVLCHPLTGRQHQIRAHLSLIGHPIVADKLYGLGDELFDKLYRGHKEILNSLPHTRHALHATRVCMNLKGKRFRFKCPLPLDFRGLL